MKASCRASITFQLFSLVMLFLAGFVGASADPIVTSLSSTRQILTPGQSATLVASATGSGSLAYQWSHNGRAIAGATGSGLSLTNVLFQDSGYYLVLITDGSGATRSAPIFVTVAPSRTQVLAWGDNGHGEITVPSGLNDAVAIAGGGQHAVALKSNGTVVAWGRSTENETDVPNGLSDVVAIATSSSSNHSLALKSDGTVVAWGFDATSAPSGLNGVVAIAAGGGHNLALKSDGTVVAWGSNAYGQTDVPSGLSNVCAIAAGSFHSLALKNDGTVLAWGTYPSFDATIVPNGLNNVSAIVAGDYHSLALKSNGDLMGWGFDGYGQASIPVGLSGVSVVGAGWAHSLALTSSGSIVAWGENTFGQCTPPALTPNVWAISGGGGFSLALRDATGDAIPSISGQPQSQSAAETDSTALSVTVTGGTAPYTYQWRKNGANILDAVSSTLTLSELKLSDAGNYDVVVTNVAGSVTSAVAILTINPVPVITSLSPTRQVLSPGQRLNMSVFATGSGPLTYQWTHNGRAIPSATNSGYTKAAVSLADGGYYVVLITDSYGTRYSAPIFVTVAPVTTGVVAWGGSLLMGTLPATTIPVGLNDAVLLSAGYYKSMAIRRNGSIAVWGSFAADEAARLAGVSNAISLVEDSYALQSDGTVIDLRLDENGLSRVPADLTNVVMVASGGQTLALKNNGTVRAWSHPSLTNGGQPSVPSNLSQVVAVSTGQYHSLALKSDGTVVAWGFSQYFSANDFGQANVPVGLSGVVAIAAGGYHSLALKSDGTVVAWGGDFSSQTDVPIGLSGVVSISADNGGAYAIKNNGSIVFWGTYNSPVSPPSGLIGALSVSPSNLGGFGLALCDAAGATVPNISIQPQTQSGPLGQSVTFSVSASGGSAPLVYQWRKNGTDLPSFRNHNMSGVNSPSLTVGVIGLQVTDAGNYDVVVTDYFGSTVSSAVVLAVEYAPIFTTHPLSKTVGDGGAASFAAAAAGYPEPTFQWRRNGANIAGATGATYSIAAVHYGDTGVYSVVATNLSGSVTSDLFTLALSVPQGFDVSGYLTRYPEVAVQFGTDYYGAWLYYRDHGIYHGEVFDDEFRVEEYLGLYPELFALFGSDLGAALDHWLGTGRIEGKLGRIPTQFSAAGYFVRNPDVAAAVNNDPILAWGHYWLYGIYEGRAYDDELRVFEYLAINADLTAAFVNDWRQAALHWMRYGRMEGRLGRLPLTFSVATYLSRNPDVVAVWGTDPTTVFLHFWLYGINEARTYDDLFRVDDYLALNLDLAATFGTDRRGAFKHWVRYGMAEGRPGKNP